jgi:hypothetical protein
MKTARTPRLTPACQGYLLTEALVYIGLVVIILGTAFAVMYRCLDNSVLLRRNAEDVTAALRAGELWRADVRKSAAPVVAEKANGIQVIRLASQNGEVLYRFETNSVLRKLEGQGWVRVLGNVKDSAMQADPRQKVTAWSWELELLPRAKGYNQPGRVRPLFTFVAVPERNTGE